MDTIVYKELGNGISQITLNDPDNLNAMGEEMAREFSSLTSELAAKAESLRAIIITGAGRAFSAGGNLEMLEAKSKLSEEENRSRMITFYDDFLGILSLNVPLIAAINGHAIGAGLCLASACDIRIASTKAKLGFTFVKLGLHPGMGATYTLPRIIGRSTATELLITGRVIEADEALRLGLLSRVVGPDKVAETASAVAEEIAGCGPLAVRQLVASLRRDASTLRECLDREADCQGVNYRSAEFKEGVRAVIEKRAPKF